MKKKLSFETKVYYTRIIHRILKKSTDLKAQNNHLILCLNTEYDLSNNKINEQNEIYTILTTDLFKSVNDDFSNRLKIEKQKNTIAYLIVCAILIIGISSFVYFRKASKYSQTIHQQSQFLEESQKKIYLNKIQQKEEQIEKLQLNLELKKATEKTFLEKIKEVKKSKDVNIDSVLKDLQIQVTNLLQIDKRHNESKFEQVEQKSDFMDRLILIHPNLSKGERQLCTHLRLNLNSKEIALIEGIGHASVRVYKTNLKRKLKLKNDESIYEYLNTI